MLVIERLPIPGSILYLECVFVPLRKTLCVYMPYGPTLGKTFYVYIPYLPSILPVLVAQLDN